MSVPLYDGVHVHSRSETAEMLLRRGLTPRRLTPEGVRQLEEKAMAKVRRALAQYCRGDALARLQRAALSEAPKVAQAADGWMRRATRRIA